jgi:multidrug resistance efflux pump
MFARITPPVPDETIRASQPMPPPSRRGGIIRWSKRAAAVAVLVTGAGALTTNAGYVTSDNAVITTHLVSLRSPIEGIVRVRGGLQGEAVHTGDFLARIENPLADDREVGTTRARLDRLHADLASANRERTELAAFLDMLLTRSDRHQSAKVMQLGLQTNRLDRDRTAKQAQLEQLVRDMQRKQSLVGVVARADIEQAETAVRIAADQVRSLDEQITAAASEYQSAADGVSIEQNGGADVTYSEQRADEVRVRLADLDRIIAGLTAEDAENTARLASETSMAERQRLAVMAVPSDGMIWRLGAAPGERVAAGDLIAQIVDCGSAVLVVAVPQEDVPDIDSASPVSFRLAGEQQDRSGHVLSITGDTAVRADAGLAAIPAPVTRPVASVLVSVPPSADREGACLVGRTARVRLPARRGRWLSWLLPRFGLP